MYQARLTMIALFCCGLAAAQTPPQTPRQALLEMLFTGTPEAFNKHLLVATRATLEKAPAESQSQFSFGLALANMARSNGTLQLHDTGPVLLTVEDQKTQQTAVVRVEREQASGNDADLELSFSSFQAGREQTLGISPRLMVHMRQESQLWKLAEIGFSARLRLDDPQFLAGISRAMESARQKQQAATTSGDAGMANETRALGYMRTLNTAEITYRASYPQMGYTCSLADLGGGAGAPSEHAAGLITAQLASGTAAGYLFRLSGCTGRPAETYRISAVPASGAKVRAFCSDESGLIRYSEDGSAERCWRQGKPTR